MTPMASASPSVDRGPGAPLEGSSLHPTIVLMATAHMVVDGYGNIYAPLLPVLIPHLHLSLAMAGVLAMTFQIASSVAQLGFGQLADRWNPRVLLMVGPVMAVTVLSLVGLATSPAALAVILVIGGLGCASFHPPAATLAHRLGGTRKGFAMSVYITGGTLGFAFGPLMFAPFVQRYGLQWTPLLALPGLVVVAFFLSRVPHVPLHPTSGSRGLAVLRPYARPLALLYGVVVLRTLGSLSFATFVPVMLTRRGMSIGQAGGITALYLFAAGIGGFIGGPAADRYGPRRVIAWSLFLSAPFLAIAPSLDGWAFAVVLAIGGFFLQSTLPVNITFAQLLAPVSAATVSSLMMGFAWGTGGLSVPLVGMLADRLGIPETLTIMSAAPIAAALCSLMLPAGAPPHTLPRAADVGIAEPA